VPVVFGSGKTYFGPVDRQHLLEDPDVVIRGNRVLHLRFRVRRRGLDRRHASVGVAAALSPRHSHVANGPPTTLAGCR
jgi:hypothetical protein